MELLPLICIGTTFTAVGVMKLIGFRYNIVGGGGKPWRTKLYGSCPTWTRHVNVGMTALFLAIGIVALGILCWQLLHRP
jgi:hypothetical protein